MKHFNIKTYYRPDDAMLEVIGNKIYAMQIQNHRFQAAFIETPELLTFAKFNDGCLIEDLTYNELTESNSTYYHGKTRYVIIGISLKNITYEQYCKILRPYSIIVRTMHEEGLRLATPTENPNIFIADGSYIWNLGEVKETSKVSQKATVDLNMTEAENEWLKLWDGFDHYWSYSDDYRVQRRCSAQEKEIHAKGEEMGISYNRRLELYKKNF